MIPPPLRVNSLNLLDLNENDILHEILVLIDSIRVFADQESAQVLVTTTNEKDEANGW